MIYQCYVFCTYNIISMILFNHVVGIVSFKEPGYIVNENIGILQPEVCLSNPLSMNIAVEIESTDGRATGK